MLLWRCGTHCPLAVITTLDSKISSHGSLCTGKYYYLKGKRYLNSILVPGVRNLRYRLELKLETRFIQKKNLAISKVNKDVTTRSTPARSLLIKLPIETSFSDTRQGYCSFFRETPSKPQEKCG